MPSLRSTLLLIVFCLGCAGPSTAAEWAKDQLVERSAAFLEVLDGGDYESAWHITTPLFKAFNERLPWITLHKTLREAYGPVTSRSVRRLSHRKTYSHSPDGNYLIIQYDSVFAHKAKAVETVILECPSPGECQVREYIIN